MSAPGTRTAEDRARTFTRFLTERGIEAFWEDFEFAMRHTHGHSFWAGTGNFGVDTLFRPRSAGFYEKLAEQERSRQEVQAAKGEDEAALMRRFQEIVDRQAAEGLA